MTIRLKGMTWSHPRGYDPMIACSAVFREKTGIEIDWDKRSLQDFESFPVKELAAAYDLIVIDHPHVGQITEEGCLHPLDQPGRETDYAAMATASVGPSFGSYNWKGRQWAFPIDAATQVQAYRPDRLENPVRQLDDMVLMAERGRALLPLRPPHSLMCFFTLAGHLGTACNREGEVLIGREAGQDVMDWLFRLSRPMPDMAYASDPIPVFEEVARPDSPYSVIPFTYGYVSYSLAGFRPARIAFADMPVIGGRMPVGSAVGGTGIAVSATNRNLKAAEDFAYFVASGAVQQGPYAASGGQCGHAAAWESDAVNAPVLGFYKNTRATFEGGWLRPRHDGYMRFQELGSEALTDGLRERRSAAVILDQLDALFRAHGPRA